LVFLLTFALGEFVAFALVEKTISQRRGGPLQITIHWETFLILSAVSVVVACGCAYRTWRGRAGATAAAPDAP
jgi:hypothetical protein